MTFGALQGGASFKFITESFEKDKLNVNRKPRNY